MPTVNRPDEGKIPGDRLEIDILGVPHVFCYCPSGTFMMGSPETEEGRGSDETLHEVTLTRGFWLGETPVTQRQWTAVMGDNPSAFKGTDRPVERVSWEDCQEFVERINDYAPDGYCFALPTEAQWEYSCRANVGAPFSFGGRCSGIECNCYGRSLYGYSCTRKRIESQSLDMPTAVKSYPPNPWGLYDMHGNVWEWCADWYGGYDSQPQTDPKGSDVGDCRVQRGGCWNCSASQCRAAARERDDPWRKPERIGFRLALVKRDAS